MFDSLRENFEVLLIVLFIISTITYIIYRATFYRQIKADIAANRIHLNTLTKKERKQTKFNIGAAQINTPYRKIIYFFADLFWVLLFVFVMRSFLFEPFIIPSSSMKPGLQISDIVIVNKFEKGLRLPITNTRLTDGKKIERGDVIVFKYPKDTKISYIKRVIGLPGDKVYYDNRHLKINGKKIKLRQLISETDEVDVHTSGGIKQRKRTYQVYEEEFMGKRHSIRHDKKHPANYPARSWTVPKEKYLVMGDNRDNSGDGRAFGFLDDKLVIGHATRIAFNFDCLKGNGKCDRFFKKIQ